MHKAWDDKRLHVICGRIFVLASLWVLALLGLFILSQYQRFLDANQKLIMDLLAVSLLFHLAFGLLYVSYPLLRKKTAPAVRPGRTVIMIISLSLSSLLLIILLFFYAWISF